MNLTAVAITFYITSMVTIVALVYLEAHWVWILMMFLLVGSVSFSSKKYKQDEETDGETKANEPF